MELDVKKITGEASGRKVTLPEDIFAIKPNDHAIYLAVKAEDANRRAGTHSTKERGDVSGTGKKPWRQKGTGNARAGSVKSPLWRGGGIIFGPRPHKYTQKLNAKVKRLARKSALSYKSLEGRIHVVEDFGNTFEEVPTTKKMYTILCNLGLAKKGKVGAEHASLVLNPAKASSEKPETKRLERVLLLVDKKAKADRDEKYDITYENFRKSCRNIPALTVKVADDISTRDILRADYLLLQEGVLTNISKAFGQN